MIFWQYLIPQHFSSALVHKVAKIHNPWFKNVLITWFIKKYQVDLTQAQSSNINDYKNFNDFFTRALKKDARVIAKTAIVSPAEGIISQVGQIHNGYIFSAKSQSYRSSQLLGDSKKADYFADGYGLSIYLSPKDYHRIHTPIAGRLLTMVYIPGTLFSVNEKSTRSIPALFARNERLICYFDTAFGLIAIILVGAIFVGSIQTTWYGQITPPYGRSLKYWHYNDKNIYFNKGEEFARFNMGSTVILLMAKQKNNPFSQVEIKQNIQLGAAL